MKLLAYCLVLLCISCPLNKETGREIIECPALIKTRAAEFAKLYRDSDTHYLWGGQDPLRTIGIDCSGLVVICYKYAIVDTKYELLFGDTTSAMLYGKFTRHTDEPSCGDLIFFSSDGDKVDHVGIVLRMEGDDIFFIDATQKYDIDGVTERSYKKDNTKIMGYGAMLLLN